jgi:Domain of unknown function (DUF4082)
MRQLALLTLIGLMVAVVSGGRSCAQSINIFGNAVPTNPALAINPAVRSSPVTRGVKFWSSEPGTIAGIRFYRAVASPQGYIARLYGADGTYLGSAALAHESGPLPGWQEADFASPIPILANTTYVASYYCPSGQGPEDAYGLSNSVTNGPLTAPANSAVGGNGVYNFGNVFPDRSRNATNYYVDIAFVSAIPAPYLILSFNPPNPRISASAPLGSVVAIIVASWSNGSPFTGSLSFAPPYSNDQGAFAISGNNLIINPSGPGLSADSNSTIDVTILASQ